MPGSVKEEANTGSMSSHSSAISILFCSRMAWTTAAALMPACDLSSSSPVSCRACAVKNRTSCAVVTMSKEGEPAYQFRHSVLERSSGGQLSETSTYHDHR